MGLKIFTYFDNVDGFKFDVMAPLSQKFQVGGSWVYSNTKSNKFDLNCVLTSTPPSGNQMMSQDDMSFISTRSDSTGRLEF
jgi:hypothetical protein